MTIPRRTLRISIASADFFTKWFGNMLSRRMNTFTVGQKRPGSMVSGGGQLSSFPCR
jgi:hypothetical protein